ncbi:MAG: AIR carboxylase family protein [Chloroflexi bacterium]|nr:AIR carboxylase family protein [Anaerolineaceae bacterium]NMB87835.1 AIR carboxylase family protein [Chloroflexota bacterium]
MTQPFVIILMGSRSDEPHAARIAEAARSLGLEAVLHIGSAHKTPEHVLTLLRRYEQDPRPKVYVTVAGRSNALSGFVDAAVTAPVIACPPPSDAFGGADLYSSLRMPSGVAPALILEPANAALLAAKILGVQDAGLRQQVAQFQQRQREKILSDDTAVQTQ